jgi:hypothetical protein
MTQEAERIDQSNQPKIVVAMEVRNEYMGDPAAPDLVVDHLDLSTLPAIDQIIVAAQRHHLAGGVPVKGRYGRIIPKNRNSEHASKV